jgi:hypothetical protein
VDRFAELLLEAALRAWMACVTSNSAVAATVF